MEHTPTTLRFCVDSLEDPDQDIKGRIYGAALEEEAVFSGSTELFMIIDKLLDKIGKPQASRQSRSFHEKEERVSVPYCSIPKIYHSSEEIMKKTGAYMTRDVSFVSRLRSSWQGIVRDEKGNILGQFESDLELIHLLYDHRVAE